MLRVALLLLLLLLPGSTSALQAGGAASRLARQWAPSRTPAAVHAMAGGNFFDTLTNNLKQISDQRVARVSHVMLRTDPAALNLRTKGEAYELLLGWKEVMGDDLEKFEICATERSECRSKSKKGDLGFVTRGKLDRAFDDVIFAEEPGRVYGPVETATGLHLIYLHSCREPESRARASIGL